MLAPLHFPRTAEEPDFITPEKRVIRRCPSKRSPKDAIVPYSCDKGKGKGKGGGKPTAKSAGKGKKGTRVEVGHKGKGKSKDVSPRPGLARATHLEDSAKTEKYAQPADKRPLKNRPAAPEGMPEHSSKPAGKNQNGGAEAEPVTEQAPESRRKRLRAARSTGALSCDDTPQKDAEATDVNQSPPSAKSEKKKKKRKQHASAEPAATCEPPAEKKGTRQTIPAEDTAEDTPPEPKKKRGEPRPETAVGKAKPPPTNADEEACEYPDNAQDRRELKSQTAEANEDRGCIQKKEHQQQTKLEDLKHVIRT